MRAVPGRVAVRVSRDERMGGLAKGLAIVEAIGGGRSNMTVSEAAAGGRGRPGGGASLPAYACRSWLPRPAQMAVLPDAANGAAWDGMR